MSENKRDPIEFTVGQHESQRLDAFLSHHLQEYSRSIIQRWIKERNVTVNGAYIKPSYHTRHGDVIQVTVPPAQTIELKPQDISLKILYEDDDIIVINKQPGLVVHPAPGNYENTLVNALLFHCTNLSSINGIIRPGIVHRLDKDTSGVLVVAKNDLAHLALSGQFAQRTIKKVYLALVAGHISPALPSRISAPIGRHPIHRKKMSVNPEHGKEAVTKFRIVKQWDDCALLKVIIKTGRTHQIRVHLSHIGHPVIGDTEYGKRHINNRYSDYASRQMLHAFALTLRHPRSDETMQFKAPLPHDMKHLIRKKRGTE